MEGRSHLETEAVKCPLPPHTSSHDAFMQPEGPCFYAHLPFLSPPRHLQTFCSLAFVDPYRLKVVCIVNFFGHKTVHVSRELVLCKGKYINKVKKKKRMGEGG